MSYSTPVSSRVGNTLVIEVDLPSFCKNLNLLPATS